MVCAFCHSDRGFDAKVVTGPYASYRLDVLICRACGSGQATGIDHQGHSVLFVRDMGSGEDRVTIGGVQRTRPHSPRPSAAATIR